MSGVKRYHVTETGLVEGQALGRLNVVLGADFDNVIRLFLDAAERCFASGCREKELQQRLTAADEQIDELTQERERLIAYGRSCGLDEASTLCSRMAYDAYYPAGSRFKVFTPKAQKALGDLLIKAANKIASLPGGPYERFKARQAQKAESAKSRQEYIRTPPAKTLTPPRKS